MTESFTLSLFVYPNFLCTTCVASWLFVPWKRFGRGVMSLSYFTSCPSENTFFGHTTTRKKKAEKSRKHLLQRDSDSEKNICRLTPAYFFRRWQIPLAVTSSTCQTSQFDKLTWQVDLRLALKESYLFSNHLTSYNLSSWLVKLTCTILVSRKCRTLLQSSRVQSSRTYVTIKEDLDDVTLE